MRTLDQFADSTTGVVYIHAAAAALCPHVEWALSSTLDARANLKWTPQPAGGPGVMRATVDWVGPVGSGARLTRELLQWTALRFEVTENASEGQDGERYCYVPSLGLWRAPMSANGDIMLGENHLRHLMERSTAGSLATDLSAALGTPWDEALESYRHGGSGAEVTVLRQRVS